MKKILIDIGIIMFVFIIPIFFICNTDSGHVCRWKKCPYKGIKEYNEYNAQEEIGTPGYYIDRLHIKYPDLDYDQLEEIYDSPILTI